MGMSGLIIMGRKMLGSAAKVKVGRGPSPHAPDRTRRRIAGNARRFGGVTAPIIHTQRGFDAFTLTS
jgi:hypothetical protein